MTLLLAGARFRDGVLVEHPARRGGGADGGLIEHDVTTTRKG